MKGIGTKVRKAVAVLLVLVMVGSVVSPVVAATTANEANTCQCSSGTCSLTKNAKVSVVELKGIEKNEAIAKALKDGDVKKLMEELVKKGHKPELARAIVNKIIIGQYGEATYVYIPFKAKEGCELGLGYLITEEGSKALATELSKKSIRLYYVDTEGVVREKAFWPGQVGVLGTWWDCVECGAACWACVIASGILAACDCISCCCYLGYDPCCDAEKTYCS